MPLNKTIPVKAWSVSAGVRKTSNRRLVQHGIQPPIRQAPHRVNSIDDLRWFMDRDKVPVETRPAMEGFYLFNQRVQENCMEIRNDRFR